MPPLRSRLTGQLPYTRALGRVSCCAAHSSGAAVRRYTRQQAELLVVQVEAEAARSEAEKGEGGVEVEGEGEGEAVQRWRSCCC